MSLDQEFAEVIAQGLLRKSVKTCSRWAERYRIMGGQFPGPWSFRYHPWTRAMHDSATPFNVGMKSAQMGYTETMMNLTFFAMDIKGLNCLYALPNLKPDASVFSASRFDPALELSEHLRVMFSSVKNVDHKRAGAANLWIRGSKSRIGFKSIDPSLVVLDEVDEMDQDNIQLAYHRTDGQLAAQIWAISTPTIPEVGIDAMYQMSNRMRWFFTCPNCWKQTTLEFPECLVVRGEHINDPDVKKSHVICGLCKKEIQHSQKVKSQQETGIWIPQAPEVKERDGYYINQLASCVKEPPRIAITAIEAKTKPHAEQELWNSIAGLPHVVAGARVNDDHLNACMKKARRRMDDPVPPEFKIKTMGVDVGKMLHFEIDGWLFPKFGPDINFIADCEILKVGEVEHFSQIVQLAREFKITYLVIDKQPEERAVYDVCCQFIGRAKRCHYARGVGSKKMIISADEEEHMINVNRTFWLDTSLGRIRTGRIIFPLDLPPLYRVHVKNLVKKYKTSEDNTDKDDIAIYTKTGPDHYGHARNYAEMALPLAASFATNQNIKSFL